MFKNKGFQLKASLMFSLLALTSCGQHFSSYYDPATNIRIKYPSNWEVVEKKDNTVVAFLSPQRNDMDAFRENVNIVVQNLSANPMTLRQYSTLAVQQIKVVNQNIQVLSEGSIMLSNKPGYEVVYLIKAEFDLKVHQMWLLDNYHSYMITYIADASYYDQYGELVKDMASSFSIDR